MSMTPTATAGRQFTVFADLSIFNCLVCNGGGSLPDANTVPKSTTSTTSGRETDPPHVWGTATDAGPSSHLGFDHHIWGTVATRGSAAVGDSVRFRAAVYRSRPTAAFEQHRHYQHTWGLGMSETFDVFGRREHDLASTSRSNRRLRRDRGCGLRRAGGGSARAIRARPSSTARTTDPLSAVYVFGGYTAGAGHQLYTARAFPIRMEPIAFITSDRISYRPGHHRDARAAS